MADHTQKNARGEPVLPNPLRDMVHTMREMEHYRAQNPSPYHVNFTAAGCCMAGTHDEDVAETILAELSGRGLIEQVPEHAPGSFRTTVDGRAWLDEQLALVGIPAFDSAEYNAARAAR